MKQFIVFFMVAILCTQFVGAQNENRAEELYQQALDNDFDVEECPEVVEWLEESAKLGYADAQFILGVFSLDQESGFAYDENKGIELLKKAAEQNHSTAKLQLGLYAYESEDDFDKAFKYLIEAYEAGETEAASTLALMYKEGQGVKKDTKKALELIDVAIENSEAGEEKAWKILTKGELFLMENDNVNALKTWKELVNEDCNIAKVLYPDESEMGNFINKLTSEKANKKLSRDNLLAYLRCLNKTFNLAPITNSLSSRPVFKDVDTDKIQYIIENNFQLTNIDQDIFDKQYSGFSNEELATCLRAQLLQLPLESKECQNMMEMALLADIMNLTSQILENPDDKSIITNYKWGQMIPEPDDAEYDTYAKQYFEGACVERYWEDILKNYYEKLPNKDDNTFKAKAFIDSLLSTALKVERGLLPSLIEKDDIKWLAEFYSAPTGKRLAQNTIDAINDCVEKMLKITLETPDSKWTEWLNSVSDAEFLEYKTRTNKL